MENKKKIGSSSASSFSTDLFGTKESPATESFASIFRPPTRVAGRNSLSSELTESMQKQTSDKQGSPDYIAKNSEGASNCISNKERSSIFQERVEPCPLSSSLYYGGQEDMYMNSSSAKSWGSYTSFRKDGREDDPYGNNSHTASRGNWWQGSLYY